MVRPAVFEPAVGLQRRITSGSTSIDPRDDGLDLPGVRRRSFRNVLNLPSAPRRHLPLPLCPRSPAPRTEFLMTSAPSAYLAGPARHAALNKIAATSWLNVGVESLGPAVMPTPAAATTARAPRDNGAVHLGLESLYWPESTQTTGRARNSWAIWRTELRGCVDRER